jgi:crotonobetainyl-CoA:carnitine CoA-transferase CaiB-like acyl-CoA transferase
MGHTGEPDGPPIKSAPPVADISTGIYAALGITAALRARERSGEGQKVEIAMLDAVLSLYSDVAANVLTGGERYGKFGSGHPDLVPYQAFPAKDGYFIVACLTNAFFKRLCAALKREDLLADPRFATNDARVKHRADIVPVLSDMFRTRNVEDWIALLEANDIPTCRVNRLEDILAHPQIAANGLIESREDARRGKITTLGPPVKMSGTPTRLERLAPGLGEHTDEILRELGVDDADVAELRAAKVI